MKKTSTTLLMLGFYITHMIGVQHYSKVCFYTYVNDLYVYVLSLVFFIIEIVCILLDFTIYIYKGALYIVLWIHVVFWFLMKGAPPMYIQPKHFEISCYNPTPGGGVF